MNDKHIIYTQTYHAPCGDLLLGEHDGQLCLCDWQVEQHREAIDRRLRRELRAVLAVQPTGLLSEAARQLDEYFRRERRTFDLPLLLVGSDFQRTVWQCLMTIPYGTTVSYGELARRLGCPQAVRAVANANGANAISIIVPCHRVVGTDRSLTGYGGGLPAKRFLLDLESNALW